MKIEDLACTFIINSDSSWVVLLTTIHDVLQKRFAREIYFKESNDSHSVD